MSKLFSSLATAVVASFIFTSAWAVPISYVEGTHYFPTAKKLATTDAGNIVVVEMFSYTCPHCFSLEPDIEKWKKTLPDDVKFVKVPAIFRDSWLELARVYYAAEATGDLEMLHPKLFNAIHVEKRNLSTESQLLDFVEEQGIDREAFAKTMNSFSVKSKVKNALIMTRTSGITGVPAFIVEGEYHTSSASAGGNEQLFEVVDMLIEQVR